MGAESTDTKKFLDHILPPVGFYILTVFHEGQVFQKVFESTALMAAAARQMAEDGAEVYHACASFKARKQRGMRKQDNVMATKAVWVDLDCGEGKEYATAKEAGLDLKRVCAELSLPLPTLVKSGRGLHAYWVFDEPVFGAAKARQVAETAKLALQGAGLKLDPSRTGDTASILRPAGTLWRKETPPREVVVAHWSKPVNRDEFIAKLEAAAPQAAVEKAAKRTHTPPAEADEFAVPVEYPPSDAKKVIRECQAIRHVAKKKGDVPEPLWYAAIGTLSFTSQGFKAGHAISKGYSGYTYEETQERMERWQDTCSGPATCEKFKSIDSSLCEGCQFQVTSPIQLGYAAEEVPEAEDTLKPIDMPVEVKTPSPEKTNREATPATAHDARMEQIDLDDAMRKKLPDDLMYWDALKTKYRVVGNMLQGATKVQNDEGEETVVWVDLLDVWMYPFRTRKNADGERTIEFYVRHLQGSGESRRAKWEVVQVPGSAVADTNTLMKTLGTFGIYEANSLNRKAKPMIKQYIRDSIRAMEEVRGAVDEFDKMGWLHGEEGFVLGTDIIADGVEYPAIVAENALPDNVLVGMSPSGSMDNWVNTVNEVYNREGAEPYQFVIASAFAAPLVKLANIPDFHGIPVAITGAGANGKTTVAQVACSVYGDPLAFYAGGGDTQATTNALLAMIGKMRHLPYLFDEVTGRKGEDLQTILYAISNGRPKLRLQRDGNFQQSSKVSWDTITYVTSNDKITEVLQQGDVRVVDATQVRVFEIHMPTHKAPELFKDVNPHDLQRILANDYGHAGREYLKYVTRNTHKVRKVIEKMRQKVAPAQMGSHDMKERFFRELVAVTLAGAYIANKLGLIHFDLAKLKNWATAHIELLRADRTTGFQSAEDVLARFFAAHSDRVVVTPKWHKRKVPAEEVARVADHVRRPVARIAHKPGKVFIDKEAFDEWLRERGISRSWLFDELIEERLLFVEGRGHGQRLYKRVMAYKGTDLPMADLTMAVYELNAAKLAGAAPDLKVVGEDDTDEDHGS